MSHPAPVVHTCMHILTTLVPYFVPTAPSWALNALHCGTQTQWTEVTAQTECHHMTFRASGMGGQHS